MRAVTALIAVGHLQPVFADEQNGDVPIVESQIVRLDDDLFKSKPPRNEQDLERIARTMTELVRSDDSKTLPYLHEVFETYPEWRNPVAAAISKYALEIRRRPQDWRLLVRSLEVVEGPQGPSHRNLSNVFVPISYLSTKYKHTGDWVYAVAIGFLEFVNGQQFDRSDTQ